MYVLDETAACPALPCSITRGHVIKKTHTSSPFSLSHPRRTPGSGLALGVVQTSRRRWMCARNDTNACPALPCSIPVVISSRTRIRQPPPSLGHPRGTPGFGLALGVLQTGRRCACVLVMTPTRAPRSHAACPWSCRQGHAYVTSHQVWATLEVDQASVPLLG
jgi:hypothetical protein